MSTTAPSPTPVAEPNGAASVLPVEPRARRRLVVPLAGLVMIATVTAYYLLRSAGPPGPLTASGTIEADEVSVAAETAGRVVELVVDEGSPVMVGQAVARLDDSLLQVQLKQADAAQRQVLETQLDKLTLRSPLTGQVLKRLVRRGEVVAAGAAILTIAAQDELKLTLYILERDLGRVRVGQGVRISADPWPGRVFPGQVQSIATRAEFTPRNVQTQRDRQTLVFAVKVRVPNPDRALKAGLPVDAVFED